MKIETRPRTSQAMPKDYLDAYKKQLQRFEKVLCLTLSSKISGCYNSAIQAREMLSENEKERVFIFDTLHAAAGQALFVLRAIELIQEQREIEEIIEELKRLIPKTQTYIIFADPKGPEFIGRITKSQANWIRRMKKLGIQPIMKIKDGILTKGGMVFAKDEPEALFKKIKKESEKGRKSGKKIRVIINHADNLEGAKKLKGLLKEIGAEVSFISEAPPIICAITGPGTLISAWQPIE
jgi:DegV family protein with EDD domain